MLQFKAAMFRYEADKLIEKVLMAIAWSMPRKLAMWCAIRVIAHATTGKYSNQVVPDLSAMDALDRWDKHNGLYGS